MESYNCVVRLGGELGQEVPKSNISAAHIIMIMSEHGSDSVRDITMHSRVMKVEEEGVKLPQVVTDHKLRAFLEKEFNKKEDKVGKVFGTFFGAKLPEKLPDDLHPNVRPVAMKKNKVTEPVKSATVTEEEFDGAEDEITGDVDDEIPEQGEEVL